MAGQKLRLGKGQGLLKPTLVQRYNELLLDFRLSGTTRESEETGEVKYLRRRVQVNKSLSKRNHRQKAKGKASSQSAFRMAFMKFSSG
ncbi:hypothetical protein PGTUg99_026006 [Puccinia graminis f. sp. tritici]|uniref:Uncharacterized protein n=1 Tax=Puccinia graminis f. sp. tritici TaxID=56615 RepID=A0A5B0R763_PUCGR|nr:hypothetical protein PGTUg99_026006 [Puccinia graminis f. sp. tritici]